MRFFAIETTFVGGIILQPIQKIKFRCSLKISLVYQLWPWASFYLHRAVMKHMMKQ
jgi:hypothetical protein